MNANSTLSSNISLSAPNSPPALTRTISSSSSISTQGSSSGVSMRSLRNTSPPLLSLLKGRGSVPQGPIPTRLASSKLILDESSPFHRRSISAPTSPPALLIIKVEGVEVKDAAEEKKEKKRREAPYPTRSSCNNSNPTLEAFFYECLAPPTPPRDCHVRNPTSPPARFGRLLST
ncbi:hypothetical protein BDY24DRAFT_414769 [Mrakia frigida]|uniref:uncharacterized protein n=1 Tax=Mrakia frigida TaxID=29902 RepID=UPI003FCC044A